MKRLRSTCVLLCLCAVTALASDAYLVKLRFVPGQSHRYTVSQTLLMDMHLPGRSSLSFKLKVEAVLREDVLDVAADGTAELLCQYETYSQEILLNGEKMAPDPKVDELKGAKARIRITPFGETEVLESDRPEDEIEVEPFNDYSFLPARAVAVGESWKTELERQMLGILCQVVINNHLESVTLEDGKNIARIRQDLQLIVPEGSVQTDSTLVGQMTLSGSLSGNNQIRFNLDTGLLEEAQAVLEGTFLANMLTNTGEMQFPMVFSLWSVTFLLPDQD